MNEDTPITIRVRVSWATMMLGKLTSALRPSRLLLLVFSCAAIGIGLAIKTETSILLACGGAFVGIVSFRLAVMAISALFNSGASKKFDGTFAFSEQGIEVQRADGSTANHAWDWVLNAKDQGRMFVLAVNERRRNVFVFLSHTGLGEQVPRMRALLQAKGKLR